MTEIIPAIMPDSYDDLADKVSQVSSAVALVQIDVMDGRFVPSRSWPYKKPDVSFERILTEDLGLPQWDSMDYEADLMVSKPMDEIEKWFQAGVARAIIHIESLPDPRPLIEKYKGSLGIGLALGTETPLDAIIPFIPEIDFVQFMGIKRIGFQGEMLDPGVMERITRLRDAYPDLIISIDGGVTLDNARGLVAAGVNRLVSGSAIFENVNVIETIEQFKSI